MGWGVPLVTWVASIAAAVDLKPVAAADCWQRRCPGPFLPSISPAFQWRRGARMNGKGLFAWWERRRCDSRY